MKLVLSHLFAKSDLVSTFDTKIDVVDLLSTIRSTDPKPSKPYPPSRQSQTSSRINPVIIHTAFIENRTFLANRNARPIKPTLPRHFNYARTRRSRRVILISDDPDHLGIHPLHSETPPGNLVHFDIFMFDFYILYHPNPAFTDQSDYSDALDLNRSQCLRLIVESLTVRPVRLSRTHRSIFELDL